MAEDHKPDDNLYRYDLETETWSIVEIKSET
jgi:hypothetical protein